MAKEMRMECLPALQELYRAVRYLRLWSSLSYRPVAMTKSGTEEMLKDDHTRKK